MRFIHRQGAAASGQKQNPAAGQARTTDWESADEPHADRVQPALMDRPGCSRNDSFMKPE